MEETPAAHVFVLAEATNCTGEVTVLLFAGEVTTTPLVWLLEGEPTVILIVVDVAPPQWSHSSTTVCWAPALKVNEVLICCAPLSK